MSKEVWVQDFIGHLYGGHKMVKGTVVAENDDEYIVQYANPHFDARNPLSTLYTTKPFPKSTVYEVVAQKPEEA